VGASNAHNHTGFSFDETTGVGIDDSTPVSIDYKEGDNSFTGKIDKVIVEVQPITAAQSSGVAQVGKRSHRPGDEGREDRPADVRIYVRLSTSGGCIVTRRQIRIS